jgi:hypothetical protein
MMTGFNRQERQSQLRATISKSASPRPLFTHLNTDASWLISVPIPPATPHVTNTYFHILLDAWLTPSNSASDWLLRQYHVETPICQNIADVLDLISDIEAATSSSRPDSAPVVGKIDAILLSNDVQDHANIDTLVDADPKTPVFCPTWAIKFITSWKHFETVLPIDKFGENEQLDWRGGDRASFDQYLPKWLGLFWLGREKAYPNLHTGTMIVYDDLFGNGGDVGEGAKGIIITTHGLEVECARVVSKAEPRIDVLAVFHTTRGKSGASFGDTISSLPLKFRRQAQTAH